MACLPMWLTISWLMINKWDCTGIPALLSHITLHLERKMEQRSWSEFLLFWYSDFVIMAWNSCILLQILFKYPSHNKQTESNWILLFPSTQYWNNLLYYMYFCYKDFVIILRLWKPYIKELSAYNSEHQGYAARQGRTSKPPNSWKILVQVYMHCLVLTEHQRPRDFNVL